MDEMARKYGNGSLKLTTRQAFQVHGILKWNVKNICRKSMRCYWILFLHVEM